MLVKGPEESEAEESGPEDSDSANESEASAGSAGGGRAAPAKFLRKTWENGPSAETMLALLREINCDAVISPQPLVFSCGILYGVVLYNKETALLRATPVSFIMPVAAGRTRHNYALGVQKVYDFLLQEQRRLVCEAGAAPKQPRVLPAREPSAPEDAAVPWQAPTDSKKVACILVPERASNVAEEPRADSDAEDKDSHCANLDRAAARQ